MALKWCKYCERSILTGDTKHWYHRPDGGFTCKPHWNATQRACRSRSNNAVTRTYEKTTRGFLR